MDKYSFKPGIYRVDVARLNVRGTPDASHEGNLVGIQLTIGKEFPVYRVISDKKGWAWGVITDNTANQEHFVCLWNINTLFASYQGSFQDNDLNKRLSKLEEWARGQGYSG